MAALDLLGRRWALRMLWELRHGPLGARALRDSCDEMSSSVLYERLAELAESGLIEQNSDRTYQLTAMGRGLSEAIEPLNDWAVRWSRANQPGKNRGR